MLVLCCVHWFFILMKCLRYVYSNLMLCTCLLSLFFHNFFLISVTFFYTRSTIWNAPISKRKGLKVNMEGTARCYFSYMYLIFLISYLICLFLLLLLFHYLFLLLVCFYVRISFNHVLLLFFWLNSVGALTWI